MPDISNIKIDKQDYKIDFKKPNVQQILDSKTKIHLLESETSRFCLYKNKNRLRGFTIENKT